MRKGEIAINVLDVCDTKGNFVYVLPGWEGYAADSRILSDALFHEKMDYLCQRVYLIYNKNNVVFYLPIQSA